MKKVWIEPGCISCGRCEFTAPEIFEVIEKSKIIENGNLEKNWELIKEAAKKCPVNVIKYSE